MPSKQTVRVTFEKGLNEFTEPSRLEAGFSTTLKNWVPEPDGSLRVRVSWKTVKNGWAVAEPATKKVRGIGYNASHLHMGAPSDALVVANAETVSGNPGYRLYHTMFEHIDDPMMDWDLLEAIGGVAWDNDKYLAMVMAAGHLLYCTTDFTRIRAWNGNIAISGTNPFNITNSRPGRTLAYFKNRIFSGGGPASTDPATTPEAVNDWGTQPYRLWFSGIVGTNLATDVIWDTTSLTNPAGFIDIGKDDGQAIEYVVPFDQGILVGKEESLYYLSGTGPSSFTLIPLDAGECAPGRSIAVTPYGAIICGREEAFIYKGNIPEPIDTPVELSYGLQAGEFLTASYVNGGVHVADAGRSAVCVYDLENDTWRIEDSGVAPGVVLAQRSTLLSGPYNSATEPLARHRVVPTGTRTVDEDLGLTLEAETPEMWLGGAARPVTLRHAYLRLRQRGGDANDAVLTVTTTLDGAVVSTQEVEPRASAGVFRQRLDLRGTAYSIKFHFIQTNTAADAAVFDIEEIELFTETEEPK